MHEIFLSYSSKDRDAAAVLQARLEQAGYSVFWDQETPVGRDWNSWIAEKLSNAKVAIVLWSTASVASGNVVHEATIARERGKLAPAVISDLKAEQFPMGFYTVQAADLRGLRKTGDHPGFDRLLAAVTALINGKATPTHEPARHHAGADPKRFLIPAAIAIAVGGLVLLAASGMLPRIPAEPAKLEPAASVAAPPKPPLEQASQILTGRWAGPGQSCAEGVRIAREGDLFTFDYGEGLIIKHVLDEVNAAGVRTVVISPEQFRSREFLFTVQNEGLSMQSLAEEAPAAAEELWGRCQ